MSLHAIRKMPLNKIAITRDAARWQDDYFTEIIERHAYTGKLHDMLREAYVLGFHHCTVGMEHLAIGNKS